MKIFILIIIAITVILQFYHSEAKILMGKGLSKGRSRPGSLWGRGNRGDIQLQNRLRYGISTWNRQELHRKLDGNSNRRSSKKRNGRRGRHNRRDRKNGKRPCIGMCQYYRDHVCPGCPNPYE